MLKVIICVPVHVGIISKGGSVDQVQLEHYATTLKIYARIMRKHETIEIASILMGYALELKWKKENCEVIAIIVG